MHRSLTVVALLFVAACDPNVHDTFRVSPAAVRTDQAPTLQPQDALERVAIVASRFGLELQPAQSDSSVRNWRSSVETHRPTPLSVRTVRAADGGVTVTVREMFTNRWSPRGDSLRRAIADTLRYPVDRAP